MQTFLEQLGGPDKLQEVVDTFVDRVVDDVMIGFFFPRGRCCKIEENGVSFCSAVFGG